MITIRFDRASYRCRRTTSLIGGCRHQLDALHRDGEEGNDCSSSLVVTDFPSFSSVYGYHFEMVAETVAVVFRFHTTIYDPHSQDTTGKREDIVHALRAIEMDYLYSSVSGPLADVIHPSPGGQ